MGEGGVLNQAYRALAVEPLDTHPREDASLQPIADSQTSLNTSPNVMKHIFLSSLQQSAFEHFGPSIPLLVVERPIFSSNVWNVPVGRAGQSLSLHAYG